MYLINSRFTKNYYSVDIWEYHQPLCLTNKCCTLNKNSRAHYLSILILNDVLWTLSLFLTTTGLIKWTYHISSPEESTGESTDGGGPLSVSRFPHSSFPEGLCPYPYSHDGPWMWWSLGFGFKPIAADWSKQRKLRRIWTLMILKFPLWFPWIYHQFRYMGV